MLQKFFCCLNVVFKVTESNLHTLWFYLVKQRLSSKCHNYITSVFITAWWKTQYLVFLFQCIFTKVSWTQQYSLLYLNFCFNNISIKLVSSNKNVVNKFKSLEDEIVFLEIKYQVFKKLKQLHNLNYTLYLTNDFDVLSLYKYKELCKIL